jgi:tetratricopeptide (TPR) repeat protein
MLKIPDPRAVDEKLRLAFAALQSDRNGEAERLARDACALAPRHAGALQLHGMTLLALDRHKDAIAPLEQAVRLNPSAPPETYLAAALRGTGRTDEATTLLRRAIKRTPPFAHAYFELGTLLHAERKLDEAEAVLRRGLGIAPGVPAFLLALGNVLLDRGDHENAKPVFERALATAPNLPPALESLGAIHMSGGAFEAAAAYFRQLLGIDRGNVKAQLLLASCLLELGKPDEARAMLRTVVTAHPSLFGQALKAQVEAGRGRLWLKPSAAARVFGVKLD